MSFSLRRPWVPKRLTRTSGRRSARPRVELLEDRRLPSVLLVMNPNDSGAGSLRQAIADANAGDTITFAAGLAPVQLTTGQLLITKDLTIAGNGPGATVVDGTFNDRVFDIASPFSGSPITVTISGVTIQHGSADVGGGVLVEGGGSGTPIVKLTNDVVSGNSAFGPGGGIAAQASGGSGGLTLLDTTVDGNTAGASGGGGEGGGIYDSGVALTVDSSTVSNNDAQGGFFGGGAGGGIWVDGTAATITNSTLSDNQADMSPSGGGSGQGGGLDVGPGGGVRLTNDTLAGNLALASGGGQGGGIYNGGTGKRGQAFAPGVSLQNTIVAGSETGGGDFAGPGVWDDLGNNLASDGSGGKFLTLPSDLNGVDPRLGPLQNNGGPTLTRALLPGSPAIDAGADGVVSTDQRGLPRPGGAHADIGAFEVQPATAVVPGPAAANAPAISLGSSSVAEGTRHFTLTVTGTNLTFTPASVVLVDGVALRARWLDGTHLQVRNFCERLQRLVFGRPRHAPRHREGFDEGLLTVAVFTPGVGVFPSETFRVLEAVAPGDAGTPLERFAAAQFEALTGQEADQSPVFQAILRTLRSRT